MHVLKFNYIVLLLGGLNISSPTNYLFTVLFEHPQLQTLVQLVFLQLPELEELLLAGVNLVQELHHTGNAGLEVRVEGHVARGAVAPAVTAVVTVSTLTT